MKRFPRLSNVLLSLCGVVFQTGIAAAQSETNESSRKVITRVSPAYPEMALRLNVTGTVKMDALVLADGTVKTVQVKGGHPFLALAAEDALRAWKWEKAEHDSTEMVEFRFNP